MSFFFTWLALSLFACGGGSPPPLPDAPPPDDGDCALKVPFYPDADQDGFGPTAFGRPMCEAAAGWTARGGDCDDADKRRFPEAPERCDGVDNDCDGQTDEEPVDGQDLFADRDGDGFGNPAAPVRGCPAQAGLVANSGDCNDGQRLAWDGNKERCDGADNDCDGDVDEGVKKSFYRDQDGDGHGALGATTAACEAGAGFVPSGDDCNDNNSKIWNTCN